MIAEILAVGTELLLGQIVDTNSAYIAEQLALAGIDAHFQTRVGDNHERIVQALRDALARADAVIVCGGLGPTQDDITREAIAAVMGVKLVEDPAVLVKISGFFSSRNRTMTENNRRQAEVPEGAHVIEHQPGTAPGLICPIGTQVIYAMPGVPHEMREIMAAAVIPDLRERSGEPAVISSRTIRTWGLSESGLAQILGPRLDELEGAGPGEPTIAFLASGIEGIKVRLTVKSPDPVAAKRRLDEEEVRIRNLLGLAVFGIDDETMEVAISHLLLERGWTLAVAESFTGGLMASRLVAVAGASRWFRGGVVAYASEIKFSLLGVDPGPVVTAEAACAMAEGVRDLLGADVGIATTGVAGPEPQEGIAPGTGFAGLVIPGQTTEAVTIRGTSGRNWMREIGTIYSLDQLRRRLIAPEGDVDPTF